MKSILVLGATSAIAEQTLRLLAKDGANFFLVGRNKERMQSIKEDLIVRGAGAVEIEVSGYTDYSCHSSILTRALQSMGSIDLAFIAYGMLGDQNLLQSEYSLTQELLEINFISTVSWLTQLANLMEKRGKGQIAVITSVAGDRGRKSNYIYGASKGALDIFLSGLRNRLFARGVNVLTIKPGFVDTPMTKNVRKNLLFAQPEFIARGIYKALKKKKDIVYLPSIWLFIMIIIRNIPESLFKRMNL
jgi:short-subunit dehydrogenase